MLTWSNDCIMLKLIQIIPTWLSIALIRLELGLLVLPLKIYFSTFLLASKTFFCSVLVLGSPLICFYFEALILQIQPTAMLIGLSLSTLFDIHWRNDESLQISLKLVMSDKCCQTGLIEWWIRNLTLRDFNKSTIELYLQRINKLWCHFIIRYFCSVSDQDVCRRYK